MRILKHENQTTYFSDVFDLDPIDAWIMVGSYEVTAETETAYEVRRWFFFREWLPKHGAFIRCEVVNEI